MSCNHLKYSSKLYSLLIDSFIMNWFTLNSKAFTTTICIQATKRGNKLFKIHNKTEIWLPIRIAKIVVLFICTQNSKNAVHVKILRVHGIKIRKSVECIFVMLLRFFLLVNFRSRLKLMLVSKFLFSKAFFPWFGVSKSIKVPCLEQ